ETYSLVGASASWMNESERGERNLTGPAIYIPINSAPGELAILIRAAGVSGGKIALLPDGEVRVDRVVERDLQNSSQPKHVVMYAINGVCFSPVYVWLDERDKFFASLDPWATVILEGWEKPAEALQAVQDQISQAHFADLARKLSHPAARGIVFAHANL